MVAQGTLAPLAQVRILARQPFYRLIGESEKTVVVMINILKPKTAKQDKLNIDTVVNLPSGQHRIQNLKYDNKGLYYTPITHEKGVAGLDLHISYHPSGEIHCKLTRGKLRHATVKSSNGKTAPPQIETLGEATPTDKDTEIVLWTKQGTPLNEIKGVVEIIPAQQGAHEMTNIAAVDATYPVIQKSKADYIFEIDVEPTPWIDITHFFMEPGNVDILEERIKSIANNWNKIKSNPKLPQLPKFKYLEKAVIFTNLIPWFVIALFRLSDKDESSGTVQSGQPS